MSATAIEALEKEVNVPEAELLTLKRSFGVETDRKDISARDQLETIGAETGKRWKSEKPS